MASTQSEQPRLNIEKRGIPCTCFDEGLSENLSLRMMQIPGGHFTMGSPENELERRDSEGPQREVVVPAFFIGKYPVMQAQWLFVAGLEPVNRELDPNPSRFKGVNRPVEQVNWCEAAEFCERLSIHTGRAYRLPTEAEWEYSCRAGTDTPFHFGETITTELANYDGANERYGAYGRGPKGERRGETTPVDYFGVANIFGLCDVHGNVYEWCQDHWYDSYKDAPTNGRRARLTDNERARRIARGGSWSTYPGVCRSAHRDTFFNPEESHNTIGFRVVCSAP
ncbi:MAG: formylglycine-generating enzyme family protein [Cyanobacteria bacterium P01_C01_bin.121]